MAMDESQDGNSQSTEAGLAQHAPVFLWQLRASGLSHAALARRAGLQPLTIANIGKGSATRDSTWSKLATALEVTDVELQPSTDAALYIERLGRGAPTNPAARSTLQRILTEIRSETHPWNGLITDERLEDLWQISIATPLSAAARSAQRGDAGVASTITIHTADGHTVEIPADAASALVAWAIESFATKSEALMVDAFNRVLDDRIPSLLRTARTLDGGSTPASSGPSAPDKEPDQGPSDRHEAEILEGLANTFDRVSASTATNEPPAFWNARVDGVQTRLLELGYDPANTTWHEERPLAALITDWADADEEDIASIRQSWDAAWREALAGSSRDDAMDW